MGDTKSKVEETLTQILKMCFSCYRVNSEDDRWLLMGNVSISSHTISSHALCPDCCKKMKLNLKQITAIQNISKH
jgi:hypothetical protein